MRKLYRREELEARYQNQPWYVKVYRRAYYVFSAALIVWDFFIWCALQVLTTPKETFASYCAYKSRLHFARKKLNHFYTMDEVYRSLGLPSSDSRQSGIKLYDAMRDVTLFVYEWDDILGTIHYAVCNGHADEYSTYVDRIGYVKKEDFDLVRQQLEQGGYVTDYIARYLASNAYNQPPSKFVLYGNPKPWPGAFPCVLSTSHDTPG